jgi:hypothetical protein
LHLCFHRVRRNDQFARDLVVGTASYQQMQHALFLGTEWFNCGEKKRSASAGACAWLRLG